MTGPVDDGEFTELVDATIPRVDLVDGAANGTRFALIKADGTGLIDADTIRDLLAKSTPTTSVDEQVTMTGSPAALASLIHQAARRAVVKAKYDQADRDRMASSGKAMADGSYPIADRADLAAAIRAVGRGGAEHDAIRRHIITRAKALGASAEIPDDWAADGSLKITKEAAMADATIDAPLDTTTILADGDPTASGSPTDPGSPAWESIDAATARKWTTLLARAQRALGVMADREMVEAATADESDAYSAMDLQDAACAVEYAISILAPFAVGEQSEAEAGEGVALIGKAANKIDPSALDTLDMLEAVTKAGRTLSAANEAAIRDASESLQKVLASLPAAPVEKTTEETTVTTTPDVEPVTKTENTTTTEPTEPVAKADTPTMRAVYDATGTLVGVVDDSVIIPVDGGPTPTEDEPAAAEPEADETPVDKDDITAAAAVTPEPTDLTPAPPDEVGIPADAVGKSAIDTELIKSIVADTVTATLTAHSATQETIAKASADALAQMAARNEELASRIATLEEQPAAPKVFTKGAVPPAGQMRGQGSGVAPVDASRAAELRKAMYNGTTVADREAAAGALQQMAIDHLGNLQRR